MRTARAQIASGLILAGCAAFGTGCAAAGAPGPITSPVTSSAVPSTSTNVMTGKPIVLNEYAAGKVVTVTVGSSVELRLNYSYWTIDGSSRPAVLAQVGAPTLVQTTPTCPPEIGCSPVRAMFTALRPGTAVLSASRNTCGEAIQCPPAKRHFQVTVIVTG